MKIAFISDVHFEKDANMISEQFGEYGTEAYVNILGSQFEDLYPKFVEKTKDVDLVINLGDAITDEDHDKDKVTLKRCAEILSSHPKPVYHVVGNHDRRYLDNQEMSTALNQADTYFSFDHSGFHHIVLDAKWDEYPFRLLNGEMQWLEKDLAKTKLPTIVYVHYPIDETSHLSSYYHKDHPERALLKERAELRSLFESNGNVRLVCFGHTHFYNRSTINGIEYINAPSFSENDGTGRPGGGYVQIDIEDEAISIEQKSVY
jgi:3',5'-cyclic-AMP phosphodiesterase